MHGHCVAIRFYYDIVQSVCGVCSVLTVVSVLSTGSGAVDKKELWRVLGERGVKIDDHASDAGVLNPTMGCLKTQYCVYNNQ